MSNSNMPDPNTSDAVTQNSVVPESAPATEPVESFKDIFSEYEQTHSQKKESAAARGR